MADTLNFQWTKAVVGGSSGAWGQIVNDALDAIDADLKTVETTAAADAAAAQATADDSLAENLAFPRLSVAAGGIGGEVNTDPSVRTVSGIQLSALGSSDSVIQIPGLAPGMRITGFQSRGQAPSGTSVTVELWRQSATGSVFVSSHVHGSSMATVATTGLTEDVPADDGYFFWVAVQKSSGSNTALAMWVQPTVVRV